MTEMQGHTVTSALSVCIIAPRRWAKNALHYAENRITRSLNVRSSPSVRGTRSRRRRRKGRWSGGISVLGYSIDPIARRLTVNQDEAARVPAPSVPDDLRPDGRSGRAADPPVGSGNNGPAVAEPSMVEGRSPNDASRGCSAM